MSGSGAAAALSIATAAICLGLGYSAQLFVKAEPFDGDPRAVAGTHNLYTVQELNKLTNKERVDAYYNKRADLHDVLQSTVGTNNVKAAYLKLQNNPELLLLKKAIEQYYPGDVPAPDTPGNFAQTNPMLAPPQTGAVAVPLPAAAAPPQIGAVAVSLLPGGHVNSPMAGGGSQTDSDSDQTIPEAGGSTDAPHPQSGGGVQPQGYLPGLARIGVGQ